MFIYDTLFLIIAIGHMASEDDEYDGYFIPKGTVVLGNAWYAFHPLPSFLNH